MKPFIAIAALFTLTLAAAAEGPSTKRVTITRVHDGDSLYYEDADGEHEVRLHWADTPELRFAGKWSDQPRAWQATAFTMAATLRRRVTLRFDGSQSFQRSVASVTYEEPKQGASSTADDAAPVQKDLAKELLAHGLAECDPRYKPPEELTKAEGRARKDKRGIWGDREHLAPRQWRSGAEE